MIRWLHKPEGSSEGKVARDEGKETSAGEQASYCVRPHALHCMLKIGDLLPAASHRQTGLHVTRRFEFFLAAVVTDRLAAMQLHGAM